MSERNSDRQKVILSLLDQEYDKIQQATLSVEKISENLKNTDRTYGKYAGKIDVATDHVKAIQKKERYDELKLQISYYTFMASATYMFVKRFYLFELVYYFLWGIMAAGTVFSEYLVSPVLGFLVTSIIGSSNDTILDLILFRTWPFINYYIYGESSELSILAGISLY